MFEAEYRKAYAMDNRKRSRQTANKASPRGKKSSPKGAKKASPKGSRLSAGVGSPDPLAHEAGGSSPSFSKRRRQRRRRSNQSKSSPSSSKRSAGVASPAASAGSAGVLVEYSAGSAGLSADEVNHRQMEDEAQLTQVTQRSQLNSFAGSPKERSFMS